MSARRPVVGGRRPRWRGSLRSAVRRRARHAPSVLRVPCRLAGPAAHRRVPQQTKTTTTAKRKRASSAAPPSCSSSRRCVGRRCWCSASSRSDSSCDGLGMTVAVALKATAQTVSTDGRFSTHPKWTSGGATAAHGSASGDSARSSMSSAHGRAANACRLQEVMLHMLPPLRTIRRAPLLPTSRRRALHQAARPTLDVPRVVKWRSSSMSFARGGNKALL